jgi:hypothetical protein
MVTRLVEVFTGVWEAAAEPPTAGAPVTVPFGVAALRAHPGRYATCLMKATPRAPDAPVREPLRAIPVTCLSVVVTQAEGADPVAVATPPATDAPELTGPPLRKPGTYTGRVTPWNDAPGGGDGTGNCGTCF